MTPHPMGTGFLRTERSISCLQRHFCARRAGTFFRSAVERERTRAPGITCAIFFFYPLDEESSPLFFFFSSLPSLRKDERRLRHPGVHLTRGRIRGKTSSFLRVFFWPLGSLCRGSAAPAQVSSWACFPLNFFFSPSYCSALRESPNRLVLPRSDALKGSMTRVIELNTATFEVRGYLCVRVKVCGAKKKVRGNSLPLSSPPPCLLSHSCSA